MFPVRDLLGADSDQSPYASVDRCDYIAHVLRRTTAGFVIACLCDQFPGLDVNSEPTISTIITYMRTRP